MCFFSGSCLATECCPSEELQEPIETHRRAEARREKRKERRRGESELTSLEISGSKARTLRMKEGQ